VPFIQPLQLDNTKTSFFLLRGAVQHVGVSRATTHLAETLAKQNKKVLIFDTLLGLKNYPVKHSKPDKICAVLQGVSPLTDIITTDKDIDIIAGSSNQNLNALSPMAKQKIKSDLMNLARNYQAVIIDCPAVVVHPLFTDIENTLWVTTPDVETLLKTLRQASQQQAPQIVLTGIKNDTERNKAHLFIKNLVPQCQIIEFFS